MALQTSKTPVARLAFEPIVRPCANCDVLVARTSVAERREAEAIADAYKYRELWEAAASCLQHNRAKIRPRGKDKERMISRAMQDMCGHFWSGSTDGWLA